MVVPYNVLLFIAFPVATAFFSWLVLASMEFSEDEPFVEPSTSARPSPPVLANLALWRTPSADALEPRAGDHYDLGGDEREHDGAHQKHTPRGVYNPCCISIKVSVAIWKSSLLSD